VKYEVVERPAYSVLVVKLEPGERVAAEAGAMMMMKGDIRVETKSAGGIFKGLLRKLTAGETIFLNHFIAGPKGGEVWLVPPYPGDIKYIKLEGSGVIVQDTCYLAHHGEVDYDIVWRGFKGVFAGGGLLWLKFRGVGGIWVSSYGSIVERDLGVGEEVTLDNLHLVAMDDTMDYEIRTFGGLKSFILGGEGVVLKVKGPGRLYMQTRTIPVFASIISKFIPERR